MTAKHFLRFHPRLNGLECRTVPSVVPNNALVVGASAGSDPFVFVIDPNTNHEVFRFMPFERSFRGGLSVAVGDLVGDATPDIVVGAASNGGPRVAIYDGETGKVARDFYVYEPTFNGGVTVAIGDVDGDGDNDLITGTGSGGGPRVVAIDVASGNTIKNFFAFEESFRGGVNVAANDVNDDGIDDIVVGAGMGGGPRVIAFDGSDTGNVLLNFFAYDSSFRGGVNVDAADLNDDGNADILIGSGTGGTPHVRVISGADGSELRNFFAFDSNLRGGARVASVDTDGDGESDTLVVGTPGHLRRFFRAVDGSEIAEDINVLGVSNGVFLGGQGHGHGKGHGHSGSDNRRVDGSLAERTLAGEIVAINSELGTITIQTGPTDTQAIFPIGDDAMLLRNGETVDDLSGLTVGDVAVVKIGSNRRVSTLATASADAETVPAPVSRSITGAVLAVDDTAGTLSVLTSNGTVFLVETDDETVSRRFGDADTLLADFEPGDSVQVRIDSDGLADRIESVSGLPVVG